MGGEKAKKEPNRNGTAGVPAAPRACLPSASPDSQLPLPGCGLDEPGGPDEWECHSVGTATTTSCRDIHEIEPREQVGARTGDLYEYQYHQAAAEAFGLLDDKELVCLFCEWHDDFVLEAATGAYCFCQVKTRKSSKGPWKLRDFFGNKLPRKTRPVAAEVNTPFARLREHLKTFNSRCDKLVFVTDNLIEPEFLDILDAAKTSADSSDFAPEAARVYNRLRDSLTLAFDDLDDTGLHGFLKRLEVRHGEGRVGELDDCLVIIASRILALSEVDLLMSQAKKMGADVVSLVRKKSHLVVNEMPPDIVTLRAAKGLVLDDVLRLLSLSPEGYRQLRRGGRESVVELSRLQRICLRSDVDENVIPELCRFKADWDAWWLEERHNIDPLDFSVLKNECATALHAHSEGALSFGGLVDQAKALAGKYQTKLTSSTPLSADLVLGFVFWLATRAEV